MKKIGISLVETMLAMSLSTVIALIGTQLLISSMRAQTNALVQQTMLDQVSYTVGSMTFDMRMAAKDMYGDCIISEDVSKGCPADKPECKLFFQTIKPGGVTSSAITFLNQRNECVQYFYDAASSTIRMMKWSTTTFRGTPMVDSADPARMKFDKPIPMISDDFIVSDAYFLVKNEDTNTSQPRITIMLEIESKYKPDGKKPFKAKIQNTVAVPNINK